MLFRNLRINLGALLLLISVLLGNRLLAQDNIALNATVLSTSYVSSWENINAINDGYEPTSSSDKGTGAYGNWNGDAAYNKWNWVAYQFDNYYTVNSSEVYWWADGAGIAIPYETYLEYWDVFAQKWVEVPNVSGNGVLPNQYNVTTFSPVVTNMLRLHFISVLAQGILEWKVFGTVAESFPANSTSSIAPDLEKGKTSTIALKALDSNKQPMPNYRFMLDVTIVNDIETINESYIINGSAYNESVSSILIDSTDNNGLVSFDISIPENVDPNDGITLSIKMDNGFTQLAAYQFKEPGMIPPVITADVSDNTVDHIIELTFDDVVEWRNSIVSIKVDGEVLNAEDYAIEAGKIVLYPSIGNKALCLAGQKSIVVYASGYNNAAIVQQIDHGEISAEQSYSDASIKVYRPSITELAVYARDAYGNPISGYVFRYDVQTINTDQTINERYEVAGEKVYGNSVASTNNQLGETNSEGKATLLIKMPYEVNLNDGLTIQFKLNDLLTNVHPLAGYIRTENEKEAYKPNELKSHSDFSWDQTYQTANFVAFWGGKTGSDPAHPANGGVSFDPVPLLKNLESYYSFYIDSLKFIPNPDEGNMGKYKFVVILFDTWNAGYQGTGTAYGGSVDGVIGAMWMSPSVGGFVEAHEFGHSCQAMVPIQYPGKGFKNTNDNHQVGMYWEACANYMAYLSTGQLGNIISPLFINTSMLQYLSTIDYRQYESVYFPAYIIDKYSTLALGKQWRAADVGDNPFDAFQKGFELSRDAMRREAGLFAMHNVTWDYSFGSTLRSYLANLDPSQLCREFTYLQNIEGESGKYIVPREMAPADYGYNIIPVFPNDGSSSISAKLAGYENQSGGGGGWSYGFVAVDQNGNPRYSDVALETDDALSFDITSADKKFYLVVIATPQRTNTYAWTPSWPQVYRFPYTVTFENALPAGFKEGYNSQRSLVSGSNHSNGGGFVASSASVAATAYVGSNAQVLGKAIVLGNARVEDFAIVNDNTILADSAIVRGNTIVGKSAKVRGHAIVEKAARVFNGDIFGNAVVTGSAVVNNCRISGDAVVKDVAWLTNVTLTGRAIVGGDKRAFTTCDEGIYLQLSRESCDQKIWIATNDDMNQSVADYTYPSGDIPEAPGDLQAVLNRGTSVVLTWDEALDNEGVNSYIVFVNGQADHYTTGTTDTLTNLKPNANYTFALRSRDRVGNISLLSDEVKIGTTVSAHQIDKVNETLKIYPTPVIGTVTIQMDGIENARLEITNLVGQTVFRSPFSGYLQIESDKLGTKGIYLVKVETGDQMITQKFLVKD